MEPCCQTGYFTLDKATAVNQRKKDGKGIDIIVWFSELTQILVNIRANFILHCHNTLIYSLIKKKQPISFKQLLNTWHDSFP